MTKESAQKCIENGRIDLVQHLYIKSLGYAGVSKFGQVVDCRKYPDSVPMQKNSLLDIPEPKSVEFIKVYLKRLERGEAKGGKRVRFQLHEPAPVIEDRASEPKEYCQPPEIEFRYQYDEILKKTLWQFVSDSRDIGVMKWIETLK